MHDVIKLDIWASDKEGSIFNIIEIDKENVLAIVFC